MLVTDFPEAGDRVFQHEGCCGWVEEITSPMPEKVVCPRCETAVEWQPFFWPVPAPEAYPWLTVAKSGIIAADLTGCTPAEADRRLIIVQELQSGRLALAPARP